MTFLVDVIGSFFIHFLKTQVLSGCVESVEDHGYIVDIGIKGTNAFLPKKKGPNNQEGNRECFKLPVIVTGALASFFKHNSFICVQI